MSFEQIGTLNTEGKHITASVLCSSLS
jgi:hypothetical protein